MAAEVNRGLCPKSSAKQRQRLGRGLPHGLRVVTGPHWLLGRGGARADRSRMGIRSQESGLRPRAKEAWPPSFIAAPSIL